MKKYSTVISMLIIKIALNAQPSFRDSVDVLNYSIHLDLSKTSTGQIWGKTDVKLNPYYELSSIKFDLEGLTTDSVFSNGKKLRFFHQNSVLNIFPDKKLKMTDTVTVEVYYHGFPIKDKDWGGFFIDNGYAFNYGVGMAATPPNYGRVWYPCIDNFTDRALYEYFITTASNHIAACPGLLISETKLLDKKKVFHWKLGQSIPTYLSSVAVSNYFVYKDTVKGVERIIPIEVYSNASENKIKHTFENVKAFVHAFEYRFGPYKWDKVGYVSTNFWSGAMEHATNIAYGNSCDGTNSCESTLAHELSHHWFGNLVTCSSEKDMWLNEGWASYSEAIYYEFVGGKKAYKDYVRANHNDVLNYAVNNPSIFGSLYGMPHSDTYGTVVYNKGADIAHTLRGQLGDSIFFSCLKQYFTEYAFKSISVEQFKNYFSKISNFDLNDFFNFWIYSPGFPDFSIRNMAIKPVKNKYQLDFTITQQLINTNEYLNSCLIEIGILDKDLKLNKYQIKQTGKTSKHQLLLDYEPKMVLIDPDEKISDAAVDEYLTIDKPMSSQFNSERLRLIVANLQSPVFFHVAYHFIGPDCKSNNPKIKQISPEYWTIDSYSNKPFKTEVQFIFNFDIFDKNQTQHGKYCLLYCKPYDSEWTMINSDLVIINTNEGKIAATDLKPGQYAIGIIE